MLPAQPLHTPVMFGLELGVWLLAVSINGQLVICRLFGADLSMDVVCRMSLTWASALCA